MNCKFTDTEKAIINMLISGHNVYTICDWLCMDYKECVKAKHQIFKKLSVTRIIQILPTMIKLGLTDFEDVTINNNKR